MLDRYLRDDGRRREDSLDRNFESRGGTGEARRHERSADPFTRDLDLPRGPEREQVRARDRVYEIDGDESRTLATIGAFRVVAESGIAVRGHRLEAADDHSQGRHDEESTNSARPDRHRQVTHSARMAPARQ